MRNPNHPQKGSIITVEPIPEAGVRNIKSFLQGNPRDLLLFTLGINNGLRIGDLLRLKVKDLKGLKAGEVLKVREEKTGKVNILCLNASSHKVFKDYIKALAPDDDDFLFKSAKGSNQPLSVPYASQMIKGWCKQVGLKGNYGSHSLRKTFGCLQRTKHGVAWEVLCTRFNHGSMDVTKKYLGITCQEINGILLNEI